MKRGCLCVLPEVATKEQQCDDPAEVPEGSTTPAGRRGVLIGRGGQGEGDRRQCGGRRVDPSDSNLHQDPIPF